MGQHEVKPISLCLRRQLKTQLKSLTFCLKSETAPESQKHHLTAPGGSPRKMEGNTRSPRIMGQAQTHHWVKINVILDQLNSQGSSFCGLCQLGSWNQRIYRREKNLETSTCPVIWYQAAGCGSHVASRRSSTAGRHHRFLLGAHYKLYQAFLYQVKKGDSKALESPDTRPHIMHLTSPSAMSNQIPFLKKYFFFIAKITFLYKARTTLISFTFS